MTQEVLRHGYEIAEWFKDKGTTFAFDTETSDLRYDRLSIHGIGFSNGIHSCYIPSSDDVLQTLRDIFKNQIKTLIAHNLVFDLKVLYKYNIPYEHCKLYCTMTADHLLDENRNHGLKYLAKTLLGKSVVTEYDKASKHGVDTPEFYQYAINDALWTWELCMWQQPLLKEQELAPLFREIEMPFQSVLLEMEVTGFSVALDRLLSTQAELITAVTELELQMYRCLGKPCELQYKLHDLSYTVQGDINFNSSQRLQEIIQGLGLKITSTTKSGALSVGKSTIEQLKGQHEFIDLLLQYKIAQKLLNAFFLPLPNYICSDRKVRPSFHNTGTKTGRLSCSNPNLQQLPKIKKEFPIDVRSCFVAPSGHKLIAIDYSGQELRVLTAITKEPVLIDTFEKGKDMHLSTANDFFHLGISEEYLYESHPQHEAIKKKYSVERNNAKIINFGMAYGKGAFGFAKDFGISEEEAQEILDKYFAALPAVKRAIDQCHTKVVKQGYVTNLVGRRRRFLPEESGYYSKSSFRQSFNFLIQGFSADMLRMAMSNVRRTVQKSNPEYGVKAVACIHDEAIYIVKEQYAEAAAKGIQHAFENAVDIGVPIVAQPQIGDNYGQCK